VPDAALAVIFACAAFLDRFPPETRDELMFILIVEGGFLMAQGTLVDIATRLQKRPPVWVIALILIGVLLFSQGSFDVLKIAWQSGSLVFVPLLISLAERGTLLWRMPTRPTIEKIAARALIANRIITGLGLAALVTVAMLTDVGGSVSPPLLAGAIYFAIAAFDDWRVRGRKFAKRPRVLFRYDAIGIDYLAPV
jgi:hypothetical protein